MEYKVKMQKGGHITIPPGLRKDLNMKPGDRFSYNILNDHAVLITKVMMSAKG